MVELTIQLMAFVLVPVLAYMVLMAYALNRSAKANQHQRELIDRLTKVVAKLATDKPYWIIENGDHGLKQITLLERRLASLESPATVVEPGPGASVLERQWGDEGDKPVPPMNPDDVPQTIAQREL